MRELMWPNSRGLTAAEAADKTGVARQAVFLMARYEPGGREGLDTGARGSHRPVSCPHQMRMP
ncbi:hypothetical protein [Mycobacterium sp. HNNTM2301]|uniref:hypothetical protein n=1 Tax=Mycobacterium hainanense TaxID=3289775 RepID=UPI0035A66609